MRLLITGGDGRLARAVIADQEIKHSIIAVDTEFTEPLPGSAQMAAGDLRNREFAAGLVKDADIILHFAPLTIDDSDDAASIDRATRGTYNLCDTAVEAGVRRIVLGSSLRVFEQVPADWKVNERWRPRPRPRIDELVPWLTELSVRECVRTAPVRAFCLRFGDICEEAERAGRPDNSNWLHINDAVQSVRLALDRLQEDVARAEWRCFHISSGDHAKIRLSGESRQRLGYEPQFPAPDLPQDVETPPVDTARLAWRNVLGPHAPIPSRPIRNIVIFGAGGPVAAALSEELSESYRLRLTDVRSIDAIRADNRPQSAGAPLPPKLGPAHEVRTTDIRNYGEVLSACEGMDAIVNCTVVRADYEQAFLVNTLGAFNVMKAAVANGIRRIVHTGPQLQEMDSTANYSWDYDIPGDAPPRAGRNLYAHSKYLGQETCRVFADYHGLEIPVLLYAQFLNPTVDTVVWTMAVSWQDSARALRRALEVPGLPSPYEVMSITNDLPVGMYSAQRAKDVLGWEAQDDLSHLWSASRSSSRRQDEFP